MLELVTSLLSSCRWSVNFTAGETINLRATVQSSRTREISDFFYGSTLSLVQDFGIDVSLLCLCQYFVLSISAIIDFGQCLGQAHTSTLPSQ